MLKYSHDATGNLASQAPGPILPPQIIGQPVTQTAEPGQLASFSVVVADAGGIAFQWKFNDADIPGATGDSLLLINVTAANAGQYSVVATNSAGSVTSAPATLTVSTNGGAGDTSLKLVAYSDPGGTVSVNPMKLAYASGESVILTAAPAAPSIFVGWAGDLAADQLGSTTNPLTVSLTASKTVRARFASTIPLPPGLVAFWRGETDATDMIGGHDGTFFAGNAAVPPSITPSGKIGAAFSFDGTVHVRVPHSPELTPAQITAEAWIFPTLQSGDHQTVIARGSPTNEDDAWWMGVFNGRPRFWSKHVGPTGMMLLEAPFAIPLNAWTHLAISFDGATKCLYVNGAQVGLQRGMSPLVYEPAPVPVTIGSDWGFGTSSARFTGLVDEVALYNRALTMNEIFVIYAADRAGKDVSRPYFTSPSPLPPVAPGARYSQQLATTLGAPPIGFSLASGAVPVGMALSPTGLLSGACTVSGTFGFTVAATDAAGKSTEQLYVVRVLEPVAPSADMVAWWRGEPVSGNTVSDAMGAHDGGFFRGSSTANASYTPDGKVGSAFAFDGAVHVRVPDAAELRLGELTAEAWVFPTSSSGSFQTFIAHGSATSQNPTWWMGMSNGVPQFISRHLGAGSLLALSSPSPLPLNDWAHVAISFDGAVKRLYVDGAESASQSAPGLLVYDQSETPLTIGADLSVNVSSAPFTGRVDEATLYRRALSSDEIFGIADADSAGKKTAGPYINSPSRLPDAIVDQVFSHAFTSVSGSLPVSFGLSTSSTLPPGLALAPAGVLSGVPTALGKFAFVVRATDTAGLFAEQRCVFRAFASVSLPAGAVGWWRAENDARDSIGSNHGALRNGAGFSSGNVGQAFALDGSTGCIEIPDAPALRPVSLTIEAWVAFDTAAGIQVVCAKPVGSGTSDSYALWLQAGALKGAVGDATGLGPILSAAFVPAAGSWHHLAYTFDDAGKQHALYLDGLQAAAGPAPRSIGYDAQPLLLGRDTENGIPQFFLAGRIDEATLYNRPLSAVEIASIYNAGAAGKRL
jgi:hypothetical protein